MHRRIFVVIGAGLAVWGLGSVGLNQGLGLPRVGADDGVRMVDAPALPARWGSR